MKTIKTQSVFFYSFPVFLLNQVADDLQKHGAAETYRSLPPLFSSREEYEAFRARHAKASVPQVPFGADYAAPAGESVTAAKAGKVASVSEDALWGGVVEVEDANGVTWRYCGVAAPAVKAGDSVTAAATLGTAGSIPAETSGDAHIHLECVKDGAYLDPEGLM